MFDFFLLEDFVAIRALQSLIYVHISYNRNILVSSCHQILKSFHHPLM